MKRQTYEDLLDSTVDLLRITQQELAATLAALDLVRRVVIERSVVKTGSTWRCKQCDKPCPEEGHGPLSDRGRFSCDPPKRTGVSR